MKQIVILNSCARWSNKKLIQGHIFSFNEIFVEYLITVVTATAFNKDELAIIPILRKLPEAKNLSDAELTILLSAEK